jgi:hypothetical protein
VTLLCKVTESGSDEDGGWGRRPQQEKGWFFFFPEADGLNAHRNRRGKKEENRRLTLFILSLFI